LPDPDFNAYRNDLADVALAGRVIASHYAEPLDRAIVAPTPLKNAPSAQAPATLELQAGDAFAMLDDSVGWAWGYAGKDRRVGYVRSDALGAQ
jgi:Bacterial dipeptidyl-peptidase Sh3 domain